jgi:hypothetical protein
MIVVDTKVPEAKSSEEVTVTGAMRGAGAGVHKKGQNKGGGPVSKIAATKPIKTKKKKV